MILLPRKSSITICCCFQSCRNQFFDEEFPEFDQKEIAIGCFGPATAKAVKDAGLRLDLEAPTVEAPSMTAALDMFIRERNKD